MVFSILRLYVFPVTRSEPKSFGSLLKIFQSEYLSTVKAPTVVKGLTQMWVIFPNSCSVLFRLSLLDLTRTTIWVTVLSGKNLKNSPDTGSLSIRIFGFIHTHTPPPPPPPPHPPHHHHHNLHPFLCNLSTTEVQKVWYKPTHTVGVNPSDWESVCSLKTTLWRVKEEKLGSREVLRGKTEVNSSTMVSVLNRSLSYLVFVLPKNRQRYLFLFVSFVINTCTLFQLLCPL